ncbi:hypothetical protein M422DRAFT_776602 [Sphaerobolus stellatus SS14]|nr:hypothetical protein M422DRAFT_776602 [Sphaerobolus stellatus SS14]
MTAQWHALLQASFGDNLCGHLWTPTSLLPPTSSRTLPLSLTSLVPMEIDSSVPSLLQRLEEPRKGAGRLLGARRSAAPYQKRRSASAPEPAEPEGVWKHDKFEEVSGGPLAARLFDREVRPRTDLSAVNKALGVGPSSSRLSGLSIRGASSDPTVIVSGLVAGTTVDDVKAIFQGCGTINKAVAHSTSTPQIPVVALHYARREDAQKAIDNFNGQVADGSPLKVVFASNDPASVREKVLSGKKNEDLLASSTERVAGKMYSDSMVDGRTPPAIGVFDPPSRPGRGGRGGRGRRGGRGGRRGGSGMEIDR